MFIMYCFTNQQTHFPFSELMWIRDTDISGISNVLENPTEPLSPSLTSHPFRTQQGQHSVSQALTNCCGMH